MYKLKIFDIISKVYLHLMINYEKINLLKSIKKRRLLKINITNF